MTPTVIPIPAAVKAEVLALLQEVQDKLRPYEVHITDEERKLLGSTAMGRESIPFALEGEQLIASFPQIFPRTVTDEMLASYPVELQSFRDADAISVEATTIVEQLKGNKLVTGNSVMKVARGGYKSGQDDNGRTPGVKPIIDRMGRLYNQDEEDDTNPPK